MSRPVTAFRILYAERYDAVTEPHRVGIHLWITVGIPVDTSVCRVDGLWGQNPSYPGVLSTTEIRPHAVHRAIRYLTCEVGAFPQYPPVLRTLWNL